MARIPRVTQSIFAGSATNNGVFGSAQASGGTLSNVLSTIMGLGAWAEGWLDAVIGGSKFPPLEEFQAVEYVHSTQIAYLLQQGIPEYDAGTTYFIDNICIKSGTTQIYKSLTDNNTGNALTVGADWQLLGDLSSIPASSPLLAANNLSDLGSLTTALTNLGFSGSPASGHQKIPNGLTIQTGSLTTGGSGTAAISFPLTFPTGLLAVLITLQDNGTQWYSDTIASSSASGFSIAVGVSYSNGTLAGAGLVYDYIAIGY